jgi:hypothetical protein
MSERSEVERALRLFYEGINSNNVSIIPLAEDVVISRPMTPDPVSGEEAVRRYIGETAPFIARLDPIAIIIEGGNAAVSIEFEGLNGVVIQGAEIFRIENGLICSGHLYFDTRPLFRGKN